MYAWQRLKDWLGIAPATSGGAAVPGGGRVVFTADFGSERQWVAGRSSAYPDMGPTNRDDHKLDHLTPRYCPGGVFRAEPRAEDDLWDCDLLTTEGSPDAFQLRAGDVLEARITLPTEVGAWPAIWTWRDGGNEVDVFEYHPDHPGILEFSNHVTGGHRYWQGPGVAPGATLGLTVVLGAKAVNWYVDGRRVYSDGLGVGRRWRAYLIVNLSVSDGGYHSAPVGRAPLSWTCLSLTVRR